MTFFLWVVSLSLVGLGVVGILVPALPGTPLIFAGLLLTAWADNFQHVGVGTIILLGLLTILAFVADFISGSLGAKRAGASREAVLCAALGSIIGIFFGFVGISHLLIFFCHKDIIISKFFCAMRSFFLV